MRRLTAISVDPLIASDLEVADTEAELDRAAREYGVERTRPPELRILLTHPGQTPAQLAECFGYTLVPTPAWEQRHMRTAQALVNGGADPNRIALFVVPGGVESTNARCA